jgi:omega-6 fatty acid desaturase (delta-12 desaturase)
MMLNSAKPAGEAPARVEEWRKLVVHFEKPSLGRAVWQLTNTLMGYALLWVLMYLSVQYGTWWVTFPLAVLAGALLVRVFIIFHDCGHGSFFESPRANAITGFLTGVLTFTPFHHWRWEHAIHHASSGNLDKRGTGDIWTMTVEEYLQSSKARRFSYRLSRNPLILFLVAPLYLFLVHQRFAKGAANPRERRSVYWMNLALLAVAAGLTAVFGWKAYLLIQVTVIAVAGGLGVWMFYVQHQFEDVYWERGENWDYFSAALEGSSFYKLPKVLQWFSGNIGFHHIHHLSARIPNYNLERCHRSHPLFQSVKPITLPGSFKCAAYRLWDEKNKQLVGYRYLKTYLKQSRLAGNSRS